MHIAFVVSSLRLSGGVILIVEIANRLARRGHAVTLLTPRDTIDPEIRKKTCPEIRVYETDAPLPATSDMFGMLRLVASFVQNTPAADVLVATHTPTTLPVLLSTWRSKTKRLWLFMDYPEMFRTRPVEQLLLRYAPGWFSTIVAISEPLADAIRPRTHGMVHVMRPGLGLAASAGNSPIRDSDRNNWRILYIGDDRPRKGLAEFLCAMEQVQLSHKNIKAVIVSKTACHIDTVVDYELLIRPDDLLLTELYRKCDLFVSTSWSEGLGYPALQAMAFGTPTVITDSGGARDYAVHGENTLLVPAQSAQAVADAIVKLMDDHALRDRLIGNGLQTAASYDWELATDAFEDALQCLIQSNSK